MHLPDIKLGEIKERGEWQSDIGAVSVPAADWQHCHPLTWFYLVITTISL